MTVPKVTVASLLLPSLRDQVGTGQYRLCTSPSCRAVYYKSESGQVFDQASIRTKVWLKDPGDDVPLCYCHQVTRRDIQVAWRRGVRDFSAMVKATGASQGGCNCQVNNPAGRCCSTAIRQYLDELAKKDVK